ncbi:MAG: TauD/TfdA family dioxygenase [Pseudomonadota bacterium]
MPATSSACRCPRAASCCAICSSTRPQPDFVYRHSWRVGDVVMWDNRAVLHRGCRYDLTFPATCAAPPSRTRFRSMSSTLSPAGRGQGEGGAKSDGRRYTAAPSPRPSPRGEEGDMLSRARRLARAGGWPG